MPIPGIPGEPTPTFRTHDRVYLSLDQLVSGVSDDLSKSGTEVHPSIVKATIQCARHAIQHVDDPGLEQLGQNVAEDLRRLRILIAPTLVMRILLAYGHLLSDLNIAETTELL